MLIVTFVTHGGTVYLYIAIPKGFFPTEDTGFISAITEGASDISFRAMVERAAQDRRHRPRGSGGRLRQLDGRRRRPESDHQHGRMFIALKPQAPSAASATAVISAPARQRQRRHRHGDLFPERPEHQHHRPHLQERIPVHAAVERHRQRSIASRRRCATRSPRSTACATSTPTSTSRIRR